MKAVGVLLLVLGLVGLVLALIFWLPSKFNPIVTVFIGAICLVAVWGGGRLYQSKAGLVVQSARQFAQAPPPRPDQLPPPAAGAFCPKCGSQIVPGQQFCGGCGSSLVSYCARCGEPIVEPSRFCGKCGARLS